MKKQTILTLVILMVVGLFSVSAMAQVQTHSVWTNNNGLAIRDAQTGCWYPAFSGFNMATSWTEPFSPTNPADAHFRGVSKAGGAGIPCGTRFYDFRLVASTSTTNDQIDGTWDVYRNAVLVCSACNGSAYGLSQAAGAGNYYKVYIDDPLFGPQTWLYSGYIDQRKDF
jgi:hypothetical protein